MSNGFAGLLMLLKRLGEEQRDAGMLPEAEVSCRVLKTALSDDASRPAHDPLLLNASLELAQIVKARGRLDEARQLCEEANSITAVGLLQLQRALSCLHAPTVYRFVALPAVTSLIC